MPVALPSGETRRFLEDGDEGLVLPCGLRHDETSFGKIMRLAASLED